MRILKEIPICSILLDRIPLQSRTLSLVRFLEGGNSVPPIHIQKMNGHFKILDGRHRVTAYRLLGKKNILERWGHTNKKLAGKNNDRQRISTSRSPLYGVRKHRDSDGVDGGGKCLTGYQFKKFEKV